MAKGPTDVYGHNGWLAYFPTASSAFAPVKDSTGGAAESDAKASNGWLRTQRMVKDTSDG